MEFRESEEYKFNFFEKEVSKGCPFCGCPKEEILVFLRENYITQEGQWEITCPQCHSSMTRKFSGSDESILRSYIDLIKSWNNRADIEDSEDEDEEQYLEIEVGKWYKEDSGRIIFIVSEDLENFEEIYEDYWDKLGVVFYPDGKVEFDLFPKTINLKVQPLEEIEFNNLPYFIQSCFPWLEYDNIPF